MQPTPEHEPPAQKWFSSLFKENVRRDLESVACFFQYGKARNAQVVVAKNRVRELKRVCKSFNVFSKDNIPTDLFQIQLINSNS